MSGKGRKKAKGKNTVDAIRGRIHYKSCKEAYDK